MESSRERTSEAKQKSAAAEELHNPNYQPWDHLTDDDREKYRQRSASSRKAKLKAMRGDGPPPVHPINLPRLNPEDLMPRVAPNGLRSVSLFSGCGGLDLGFERAGYQHVASYDILEPAGETLRRARPDWEIFSGDDGDVRSVDWTRYQGTGVPPIRWTPHY